MADIDPIQVQGLDHFFGAGDARKQAIFDINLTIKRGSLTILMGPSGSGKTTLLTLIGALRDVQSGHIRVLDRELNGADEAALVQLRRRLGFIFQAHNLHESLTATQNVLMGLQVHGAGDTVKQRTAAHHMLDLLGLSDRRDYLPGSLSGGQKQRVAVRVRWCRTQKSSWRMNPPQRSTKHPVKRSSSCLRRLGNSAARRP